MKVDPALGGLMGLLVGDAVGVPYEFSPPESIPNPELIEPEPPDGFVRAHAGTPIGTWSDDGALALALFDAMLAYDTDVEVCDGFAKRLLGWYMRGEFTPDGRVFDVGGTTIAAINRLRAGKRSFEAGGTGKKSNGNGSLMRTLPVALLTPSLGVSDGVIRLAMRQSCVTHRHPLSQVCCAVYAAWAHMLGNLQGPAPFGIQAGRKAAFDAALRRVREYLIEMGMKAHLAELEIVADAVDSFEPAGTGYVLDTLITARAVIMNTATFEDAIRVSILYGNDTDTTACVVGGVAGLIYGLNGIPRRWVEALQGEQIYGAFASSLITRLPESNETLNWEAVK